MSKWVVETDELLEDVRGLKTQEVGLYFWMLIARVEEMPVEIAELERLSKHEGVWLLEAMWGLHDKGKIVLRPDGTVDIAERRYRHQLRSGEPV